MHKPDSVERYRRHRCSEPPSPAPSEYCGQPACNGQSPVRGQRRFLVHHLGVHWCDCQPAHPTRESFQRDVTSAHLPHSGTSLRSGRSKYIRSHRGSSDSGSVKTMRGIAYPRVRHARHVDLRPEADAKGGVAFVWIRGTHVDSPRAVPKTVVLAIPLTKVAPIGCGAAFAAVQAAHA